MQELESSKGVIVLLPTIVKATPSSSDGRRLVEVGVSAEIIDSEGDLILQKALLDSAPSFISNGHIDVDHLSELGGAMGIPNPLDWIIGRPLEVWDGGDGQTMMKGEIQQARPGQRSKADAFWDSLIAQPPVLWRASVYGFLDPETTVDCRNLEGECPRGATRFVVNKFDWRSLAFTRNPVNQGIKSYAKVVAAKSWVAMAKAQGLGSLPDLAALPRASLCTCTCEGCTRRAKAIGFDDKPSVPSMALLDREAGGGCPTCGGLRDHPTLPTWRGHLEKCLGWTPEQADLGAHAAMYRHLHKAMIVKIAGEGPRIRGPGNKTLESDDPLDCPRPPSRSQG